MSILLVFNSIIFFSPSLFWRVCIYVLTLVVLFHLFWDFYFRYILRFVIIYIIFTYEQGKIQKNKVLSSHQKSLLINIYIYLKETLSYNYRLNMATVKYKVIHLNIIFLKQDFKIYHSIYFFLFLQSIFFFLFLLSLLFTCFLCCSFIIFGKLYWDRSFYVPRKVSRGCLRKSRR